jgi:hypothetical protein
MMMFFHLKLEGFSLRIMTMHARCRASEMTQNSGAPFPPKCSLSLRSRRQGHCTCIRGRNSASKTSHERGGLRSTKT